LFVCRFFLEIIFSKKHKINIIFKINQTLLLPTFNVFSLVHFRYLLSSNLLIPDYPSFLASLSLDFATFLSNTIWTALKKAALSHLQSQQGTNSSSISFSPYPSFTLGILCIFLVPVDVFALSQVNISIDNPHINRRFKGKNGNDIVNRRSIGKFDLSKDLFSCLSSHSLQISIYSCYYLLLSGFLLSISSQNSKKTKATSTLTSRNPQLE